MKAIQRIINNKVTISDLVVFRDQNEVTFASHHCLITNRFKEFRMTLRGVCRIYLDYKLILNSSQAYKAIEKYNEL